MSARLSDWRGRATLITGASSGIGEAFALAAAERGARLALVSRTASKLEGVAERARQLGAPLAEVLPCDVSDRHAVAHVMAEAEARLGGIDVALLGAGVGRHRTLLEHDLEDAASLIETNLLGALYCAHPLARAMACRGRGWMVFMASIAGLVPVPGEAVYSASKHGLVGLAEALSMELEPRGVSVLTVCPGAVRGTSFVPSEEAGRIPEAARRTAIDPSDVVEVTFDALARGKRRVITPRRLGAAVVARGLFPAIVRSGTVRATRESWDTAAAPIDPLFADDRSDAQSDER